MTYPDMQSFIAALDDKRYLRRIAVEVDPELEISAITDRVCKMDAVDGAAPPSTDPVHGRRGGAALLFENVRGASCPVAINTFGSYERVRMALGCSDLDGDLCLQGQ